MELFCKHRILTKTYRMRNDTGWFWVLAMPSQWASHIFMLGNVTGVQMVIVARVEGVNVCSLPPSPWTDRYSPAQTIVMLAGAPGHAPLLTFMRLPHLPPTQQNLLSEQYIWTIYWAGLQSFFLHTVATVLTHWLKLAYIIMNWNMIGLVDVSLFWIYNVQ